MSSEKKKKFIEIGPDDLSELLKDFEEFQKKMDQLQRGEDPFSDREDKAYGGPVGLNGSLMDKDIRQPVPRTYRLSFEDGGSARDKEIGFLLQIINLSPLTPQDAFYVEEAREKLSKMLTPAEKRMFNFVE